MLADQWLIPLHFPVRLASGMQRNDKYDNLAP